jgi:pimeloyl-ACP methyl ester carboxylesterase
VAAGRPWHVIWLPGANNGSKDFLAAGFATAVAKRGLPITLTFVDPALQHVQDRESLRALRGEFVLPARERGEAVWLGGISLGALFALDFAAHHGEDLAGLCLLAPYLGNRMLLAEIRAAGGPAGWDPGALAQSDEERRIWRYIKERGPAAPALRLGFGRGDRFASAHDLLAQALCSTAVTVIDGAHDWQTWSALWERFLDSIVL